MLKFAKLILVVLLLFTTCKKGADEPTIVIPLAPSGLNAVQIPSTQVNLNWTDNSTNEEGFKIERKFGAGNYELIGTVSENITTYSDQNNIQPGKAYVYRVYAYNKAGNSITYSNESSINSFNFPGLSTAVISQNAGITAVSGGIISNDGGSPITAKGIVWSITSNPTVSLATKTNNGTGTGTYTSNLSNLSPITTYYVRAYATNGVGTAYGNEISFKSQNFGITIAGGNGGGSAANQFIGPKGVFVDAAGNIYVADVTNQRIQRWAPGAISGVTVAGGNGKGSAANQFDFEFEGDVFVDAAGNIYVADVTNQRIQRWAPGAISGVTVAGGNGMGFDPKQFWSPIDVFVDAAGNIFVVDLNNQRIQRWAPGAIIGVTVAGGNGAGSAANQFNFPTDVFVDAAGNVYVADSLNQRIQKWAQY